MEPGSEAFLQRRGAAGEPGDAAGERRGAGDQAPDAALQRCGRVREARRVVGELVAAPLDLFQAFGEAFGDSVEFLQVGDFADQPGGDLLGFFEIDEQALLQLRQFGWKAGVFGGVGRSADRVGAAEGRRGLPDGFERRAVVGVGLAHGHRLQLPEGGRELFVRRVRRRDQLRQRDLGVFVERLLRLARAPQGVVTEVERDVGQVELQQQRPQRDAALGAGELAGAGGEGFERVDRPLAAGAGGGEAARDRQRPGAGPAGPLGEQAGPGAGLREPPPQQGDAAARAGQVAAEPAEARERPGFAARGEQRRAGLAQRFDGAGDLRRADHRLDAGQRRDPALPASEGGKAGGIGDLAVAGGDDEHERRFEAGADRAGDQFEVLPGGSVLGQLRLAGRASLQRDRGRGEEEHDRPDRDRDRGRAPQGGVDQGHQARASIGGGADPPAIQVRAEQNEDGGGGDGGDEDAERDDHRHRRRQRGEQRAGDDEERDQHREQQRAAGEDRGAPRGSPRHPGRVDRVGAARQLLAEAGDHQQRVVDAQRQPHHRADGEREGVDVEPAGEDVEQAARADHRHGAEGERDHGGDRRAEYEQEDDQQDRQRDQLSALAGGDRFVLDRPRQGGVAGLGGANRRPHVLRQDPVQLRDRVVDGLDPADVEVDDDQGAAGARAQPRDGAAIPGGEGGHRRAAVAQGANERRALAFERGRRAAQEDRERGAVAEVLLQHPVGARGGGSRNVQRGRAEPSFDPGAEDAEEDEDEGQRAQHTARVTQHQRGAAPHRFRAAPRLALLLLLRSTRGSLAVKGNGRVCERGRFC